MSFYEHVVIARQDLSAQQAEGIAADLTKIVEDNGGKVVKAEQWGLRNIAYKINKNRKGHYIMLVLDAPGSAVAELERNVRLNEDIIRYLTIRVEAVEEGPSAVLQAKFDRSERGDREGGFRGERGERSDRGDRGDRPRRDGDRGPRRDRPADAVSEETGNE
ncbi:30S ribosomal protein S6 [Govanella unica]|uniref:Small ribosomal subunit protein bS6 n=1 Tax=Govanella unica TaxID=2975056 RepID=A0A9X3Z7T8_9PROT|nr:30S ribosomal protein S6 [Govania unica]MDA5194344.1 30S ribosomal protein S6 [Govania unica]